jgi:cytochrome c553
MPAIMAMLRSYRIGISALLSLLAVLPSLSATASPARSDELVSIAMKLDRHVDRGASAYKKHCASCHGAKALGDARTLVPALARQRQAYLIKQLADFAEMERESPAMHVVVSRAELTEPQAWADIAAYLNGLPPLVSPETGDGSGVELGEAIFHEQCASCHSQDGGGDDDGFVPSLRNQHYSYLLQQMRSLATWHRYNVDEGLVRFIDSLDTEELTSVTDYVSRMRDEIQDRAKLRDDGTIDD